MAEKLDVLVAHKNEHTRSLLLAELERLGHNVVEVTDEVETLIQAWYKHRPSLIVTGVDLDDADGIEALIRISEDEPVAAIVVTHAYAEETVRRAAEDHVMAYLLEPFRPNDLQPAIIITMQRFRELQALREETAQLKQTLADRKVIERAKGVLMRRADLTEEQAFLRLQKLASSKRRRLIEIAQSVLLAEEALAVVENSRPQPAAPPAPPSFLDELGEPMTRAADQ